eukprot:1856468-Amphidinium_carterae.4
MEVENERKCISVCIENGEDPLEAPEQRQSSSHQHPRPRPERLGFPAGIQPFQQQSSDRALRTSGKQFSWGFVVDRLTGCVVCQPLISPCDILYDVQRSSNQDLRKSKPSHQQLLWNQWPRARSPPMQTTEGCR